MIEADIIQRFPAILLFDEAAQNALISAATELSYRSNRERLMFTVMDLMESGGGVAAAEYLWRNGFRDNDSLIAIRDSTTHNLSGMIVS